MNYLIIQSIAPTSVRLGEEKTNPATNSPSIVERDPTEPPSAPHASVKEMVGNRFTACVRHLRWTIGDRFSERFVYYIIIEYSMSKVGAAPRINRPPPSPVRPGSWLAVTAYMSNPETWGESREEKINVASKNYRLYFRLYLLSHVRRRDPEKHSNK